MSADIPGIRGIPARLFRARSLLTAHRGKSVTQGQIAEAIGVSEGLVGHWEKGRQVPDVAMLERLAVVLEVSPVWLINGVGEMAPQGAVESEAEFQTRTGLALRTPRPIAELTGGARKKKPAAKKSGRRRAAGEK